MTGVSVLVAVDRIGEMRPDLGFDNHRTAAWIHCDEVGFHGRDATAWRALATAATACADALEARAAQDQAAADGVARITGASS